MKPTASGSRRVYSEHVSYERLSEPVVTDLLSSFGLELVVGVFERNLKELPALLNTYAEKAIPVSIWPMLSNEEGRWASVWTCSRYCDHAERVVDAVTAERGVVRELVVDLEPPIHFVRALTHGQVRLLPRATDTQLESFVREFTELARWLSVRELRLSCTAIPLVLFDRIEDPRGSYTREQVGMCQRVLGTPVFNVPWDRITFMAYTSLLEGYSRGLLGRSDALAMLSYCARKASLLPARVEVALGAVGPGALQSEPTYASPGALAEDLETAVFGGITDFALFDLEGILTRGRPEAWLHAFSGSGRTRKAHHWGIRSEFLIRAAQAAVSIISQRPRGAP